MHGIPILVGDMSFAAPGENALDYLPCRYGTSKILFRGPRRDLTKPYVACLGGTETYGKFVEAPFVNRLEMALKVPCINFGCPNAGVDVFLNEPVMLEVAKKSQVTVLQVPSAQNMSNRLYTVHPRRNDRFVSATKMMHAIFPDVDFAGFHFNKHLLRHLREKSQDRYALVEQELHDAWIARVNTLLTKIPGKTVLLWVSERAPGDIDHFDFEPMHVTSTMIEAVSPNATAYVEVVLPEDARSGQLDGMVFSQMEAPAAQEIIGVRAHAFIAEALQPTLKELI